MTFWLNNSTGVDTTRVEAEGVDTHNTYNTTEADVETYSKDTIGPQEQHTTHGEWQYDEPTIQDEKIVEEMNATNMGQNPETNLEVEESNTTNMEHDSEPND